MFLSSTPQRILAYNEPVDMRKAINGLAPQVKENTTSLRASHSAEGAAEQLAVLLPRLRSRFREVVVRGDSAFCRKDISEVCEANGASFTIVSSEQSNFPGLAEGLSERAWKRFRPCVERARRARPTPPSRRWKRRRNLRRQIALRRRKRDLRLQAQWIAELPYQPTRMRSTGSAAWRSPAPAMRHIRIQSTLVWGTIR